MDQIITLDYGSGGQKTSELIERLILPSFDNAALNTLGDGAALSLSELQEPADQPGSTTAASGGKQEAANKTGAGEGLVFSTDSFVVSPYFFPGGDIGKLSVCGTVNDLAVSGGIPKFLSLSLILEEGLPVADLETIVSSIKTTADQVGVKIVTGDTKVVERGKGDGIYINTAGIGVQMHRNLSPQNIRPGDAVIVSGPVGNHGVAVMLARDPGFMNSEIRSDCAPVCDLAKALFSLGDDLKIMRDPTRGGLATTLCEFVEDRVNHLFRNRNMKQDVQSVRTEAEGSGDAGLTIELQEASIPVDPSVQAACDVLGLDPFYAACEGRLIAIVSKEKAEEALSLLQTTENGKDAAIIGHVTDRYPGRVVLHTPIGGTRILTKLTGAQLPRIC